MVAQTHTLNKPYINQKRKYIDSSFQRASIYLIIGSLFFLFILFAKNNIIASKFFLFWLSGGCIVYAILDFKASIYILSFTIPLEQAITNWGGGRFNSVSYLLIIVFIISIFKYKMRAYEIKLTKLEIIFIFWIIYCAATILWSNHKIIGIGNTLYHIGGFLIIFLFTRELKDPVKLIKSVKLYIIGIILMTVAVFTTYRPGSAMIKKASGEWINNALGLGTDIDPHQYARGAIVGLILSLFIIEITKSKKIKYLAFCFVIILGFSIPLTLNRSSVIMEVLALTAWVFTSKGFSVKMKKIFILFILILSISYIVYKLNYKAVKLRFETTQASYTEENWRRFTAGRYYIWKVAFNLFLENPFGGVGLGSFSYRYALRTGDSPKATHNAYLKFLVETGIFGFLLFSYIIASIGITALKLKRFRHIAISLWVAFAFIITAHELLRAKDFWFASAVILAFYSLENLYEKSRRIE